MAVIGADFSGDGDEVYLIDSIFMNGQFRKRWHTLRDNVIIEGIGSLNRMPMSYPYIGNVYAELLCFSVDDSLIYQSPKYKNCDTSWHINLSNANLDRKGQKARFFLDENGWEVRTPKEWSNERLILEIFNLNGKKLNTLQLQGEDHYLTNQGLDAGLYLYRIYSAFSQLETGKLLNP